MKVTHAILAMYGIYGVATSMVGLLMAMRAVLKMC
jgi:hypothetical protein